MLRIQECESSSPRVGILGGLGGMAGPTNDALRRAGYYDIIISDPRAPGTHSVRETIRQSKIVYFSVFPPSEIPKIIWATLDVFDDGRSRIVLDNTTRKGSLEQSLRALNSEKVSSSLTHPLCKPDQSWVDQNVVIIPFGEHPQAATMVAERVYRTAGMKPIYMDLDEHDSTMTVVQCLPHFINRVVTHVLAQRGIDLQMLLDRPPVDSFFYVAQTRTLIQKSAMSASIISDDLGIPAGQQLITTLIESTNELLDAAASGELTTILERDADLLDPSRQIMERVSPLITRAIDFLTIPTQVDETVGMQYEYIAALECFPRFVSRVVAHTLVKMGIDLQRIFDISTANSLLFYLAGGQILTETCAQSAARIRDGLNTTTGQALIRTFIQGADKFVQASKSKLLESMLQQDAESLDRDGKIRDGMNPITIQLITLLTKPLSATPPTLVLVGSTAII